MLRIEITEKGEKERKLTQTKLNSRLFVAGSARTFRFYFFTLPKWPLHCSIARITPLDVVFFPPAEKQNHLNADSFIIPNGSQIFESSSDDQTQTFTATHRHRAIRSLRTKWIFRILFLLFWRNRKYAIEKRFYLVFFSCILLSTFRWCKPWTRKQISAFKTKRNYECLSQRCTWTTTNTPPTA